MLNPFPCMNKVFSNNNKIEYFFLFIFKYTSHDPVARM